MPAERLNMNITCYGFHVWAEDFLAAERVYAPTARPGSVAHFLCCQSVELSLKAFLSLKGMDRDELRKKYGHNLRQLYDEACRQGISEFVEVDVNDGSTLQAATDRYDRTGGKSFQYFDIGDVFSAFKHVPDLAGLEGLASRLQSDRLRAAVLEG